MTDTSLVLVIGAGRDGAVVLVAVGSAVSLTSHLGVGGTSGVLPCCQDVQVCGHENVRQF